MKQPILYFGVALTFIVTGLSMLQPAAQGSDWALGAIFTVGGGMVCAGVLDRWIGEAAYLNAFVKSTLRTQGKVVEALRRRGLVVFVDPDTEEVQLVESDIEGATE